jgi:type IV secretion system protein VirB8
MMSAKGDQDVDSYFQEAGSWAYDRQDELRTSRRWAWIVAAVAVVIALFEAAALLLLVPLRTVVPYTLLVDRQTGYVQALEPVDAQLISSTAALTQSFLVQYVIAREGYDRDTLQADYRKVGLWSAGSARRQYIAHIQASNPNSPLVRLPPSSEVNVQVKSVTPLGKNVSMVRFATRRHDARGRDYPTENWVAVIRYSYSGEPMSVADRYVNPLGFKVEHYRRSAETLPVEQPPASTSVYNSNASAEPSP